LHYIRDSASSGNCCFKTSYYLPTSFLSTISEKEFSNLTGKEEKKLRKLQEDIGKGNFDYISTYSKYYSFIKRMLSVDKEILLWNVELEPYSYFDRKKILKIISQDNKIKILLVKLKSKYDR